MQSTHPSKILWARVYAECWSPPQAACRSLASGSTFQREEPPSSCLQGLQDIPADGGMGWSCSISEKSKQSVNEWCILSFSANAE